jgi:hypothetical protein
MRFTALIACATLLAGPAPAADPQMLTNTALPVSTLSEKQTRRLLSGVNLKAKMKAAMRLDKQTMPGKAAQATSAQPASEPKAAGSQAPAAVAVQLRPPIATTGATTETTAPGWTEEGDPLTADTGSRSTVSVTQSAALPDKSATVPSSVAAPGSSATPGIVTPAATTSAAELTAGPTPAATTSSETASAAEISRASQTATATAADTTSAAADSVVATTSDTTGAQPTAAAKKIGEFNVEPLGGNLIKSGTSPDGVVALSPTMNDAVITSSPAFLDAAQVKEGPIVIDNDEIAEQTVTIAYEEMPTEAGGTAVKAGARFPVVMISELNSKTAKKGDPIEARLKYDLKIGNRHIANKGSRVRGHLNYVLRARTVLGSMVTTQRFYRNSGVLGIAFDELINEKGEHFTLLAKPAMMDRIVKNKYEGRELGVNHNGQVTGPFSQQLRYKAIRVGMNFAMAPLGPMTFGAMPIALGVMGAVNPSFAFMKPVGLNVRHRRIKGFFWGALSGVPGSWLIEDTTVRGQEAIIKPGDEFLAVFNEQFKGEAVTDASLIPGVGTKVKGEVLSGVKAPAKKKK